MSIVPLKKYIALNPASRATNPRIKEATAVPMSKVAEYRPKIAPLRPGGECFATKAFSVGFKNPKPRPNNPAATQRSAWDRATDPVQQPGQQQNKKLSTSTIYNDCQGGQQCACMYQ